MHGSARRLLFAVCIGALGCSTARVSSNRIQPLRAEPTACASIRSADTTIYDTTQISERPLPGGPTLEYPPEARRRGVRGRTVVTGW